MSDSARRLREAYAEHADNDHPDVQTAFDQRMTEVLAGEMLDPHPGLYWLSFVGEEGFRGVAIVKAIGHTSAVMETHARKVNPGGEVQGQGPFPYEMVPPLWRNRLLTRAEVDKLNAMNVERFGE